MKMHLDKWKELNHWRRLKYKKPQAILPIFKEGPFHLSEILSDAFYSMFHKPICSEHDSGVMPPNSFASHDHLLQLFTLTNHKPPLIFFSKMLPSAVTQQHPPTAPHLPPPLCLTSFILLNHSDIFRQLQYDTCHRGQQRDKLPV